MDLAWYVGMAATVLNMVALVPQVLRGFRTKKVCDLSWGWLEMIFAATLLWLMYGVMQADAPLILANAVAGVCYGLIVLQKLIYPCR